MTSRGVDPRTAVPAPSAGGAPAPPRKATAVALNAAMTPDQALRAVVGAAFTQLRANESGTLWSEDPEYIHQMRVAIRRMRSALRLFDTDAARALRKRCGDALKELAAVLGRARDLDVFVEAVAPALRDLPPAVARRARASVKARVRAARESARTHLRSPGHERLMTRIALWLAVPSAARGRAGALPALARKQLNGLSRKVARGAARFADLDDEARHDLRIDIKRARYAAEFFADLYERSAAKAYAAALASAQDSLGSLTDIKTAQALLRDFEFEGVVESRIMAEWIAHAAGAEAALERAFAACAGAQGYWQRQH